jgi:hypothetical protein
MPTILRDGPYRFFFYSGDGGEPFHVHIERENKIAKVWLDPIRLYSSGGFNRSEILKILKIIERKREIMMESWNDYFSN